MKPNPNPEKETLKAKLRVLSAVTKRYFGFSLLALISSVIICGLFVVSEASALSAMAETLLVFSAVYIFLTTAAIGLNSMYDQERNVIAGIVPLIMTIIGLTLAFWLYDEYLSDQIGLGSVVTACLALSILPLMSFVLRRALSLAVWKLYLLSFLQIIITGLLAWLEFTWFI